MDVLNAHPPKENPKLAEILRSIDEKFGRKNTDMDADPVIKDVKE